MILLDILKVFFFFLNHSSNQNVAEKEEIMSTGLVFRLGGAIVVSFFFFSCDRSSRTVSKNSQIVS